MESKCPKNECLLLRDQSISKIKVYWCGLAGAVCGRTAGARDSDRCEEPRQELFLRRIWASASAHVQRFHHHEPWLRRPVRASRQLESAVPNRRYDGARLRHDFRDHAVLKWLSKSKGLRSQDCCNVQALLGATLLTGPLRLRCVPKDWTHMQKRVFELVVVTQFIRNVKENEILTIYFRVGYMNETPHRVNFKWF